MWFNAIIRAKPYQFLNRRKFKLIVLDFLIFSCHTGVARLSSVRVVRCLVHSFNERNSCLQDQVFKTFLKTLLMINLRKVRIKSSLCGPYKLGYTCATMKITKSH